MPAAIIPARTGRTRRTVHEITCALTVGGLLVLATFVCGAPKANVALADGPISYFNAKCARCHGPYGSFYGEDFGRKLTDRQLRKVVADMAAGPAQASLSGQELEAQVAFHRALIARQPFLAWTGMDADSATGEVTPGARVHATVNGRPTQVKTSRHTWQVRLPGSNKPVAVSVSASSGKTSVTLDLGRSAFTHAAPLSR